MLLIVSQNKEQAENLSDMLNFMGVRGYPEDGYGLEDSERDEPFPVDRVNNLGELYTAAVLLAQGKVGV